MSNFGKKMVIPGIPKSKERKSISRIIDENPVNVQKKPSTIMIHTEDGWSNGKESMSLFGDIEDETFIDYDDFIDM